MKLIEKREKECGWHMTNLSFTLLDFNANKTFPLGPTNREDEKTSLTPPGRFEVLQPDSTARHHISSKVSSG